jgi:serine O-acetyltransferase
MSSVTIGAIDTVRGGGKIEIGNNVYIGSGAKLIGNFKIGNNVNIGANAVVLNDIPNDCTVVGVPARIIHRKNDIVEYM